MTSLELAERIARVVLRNALVPHNTYSGDELAGSVLEVLIEHDAWFCEHGTGPQGETTHRTMEPSPEQLDMFAHEAKG